MPMVKKSVATAILSLLLASTYANAADLGGGVYRSPYCPFYESSQILTLPQSQIEATVQEYFDMAKAEMGSSSVIISTSPVFTWASETRHACRVALGYFKTGNLDEVSVQKCDCFYRRMTTHR